MAASTESGVVGRRRIQAFAAQLMPLGVAGADAPHFVTLEKAANMPDLRITLIPGVPGVYAECLKNLLDVRGVDYTRVLHPLIGQGDNQAFLYQITAQKSLPTMLYNDERPRNSWVEQTVLADQLGKGSSLIPSNPSDRVLMWGLMNELLAEDGIVWRKRLLFGNNPFTQKYGYRESSASEAPAKIAESIQLFVDQLRNQRSAGSKHIVGASLSILDVYLATSSIMLVPPGPEIMPRTKENAGLLKAFAVNPPEVQAVLTAAPELTEYRDYIYKNYLVTPAVLGGTPL